MTPLQPPRPPATQPPREPLLPPRSAEPPSQPCAAGLSSKENTSLPFEDFREYYRSSVDTNSHDGRLCLGNLYTLGNVEKFKQKFLESPKERRALLEGLIANTIFDAVTIKEFLMLKLSTMKNLPPNVDSERIDNVMIRNLKMIDMLDHKIFQSILFFERMSSPGGCSTPSNRIAVAVQNNLSVTGSPNDKIKETTVYPLHDEEAKHE